MAEDLGPQPEPQIEPGEPNPGGVDAIDPDSGPIAIPDLALADRPGSHPPVPDSLQEMSEPDDTSTQATASDPASNAEEPGAAVDAEDSSE
jgi:hypothetical protein